MTFNGDLARDVSLEPGVSFWWHAHALHNSDQKKRSKFRWLVILSVRQEYITFDFSQSPVLYTVDINNCIYHWRYQRHAESGKWAMFYTSEWASVR